MGDVNKDSPPDLLLVIPMLLVAAMLAVPMQKSITGKRLTILMATLGLLLVLCTVMLDCFPQQYNKTNRDP